MFSGFFVLSGFDSGEKVNFILSMPFLCFHSKYSSFSSFPCFIDFTSFLDFFLILFLFTWDVFFPLPNYIFFFHAVFLRSGFPLHSPASMFVFQIVKLL